MGGKASEMDVAFIAGAGLGTRLRPLTERRPKPLVPFLNRPLITHIFDRLIAAGFRRVVINTHHCASAYDSLLELNHGEGYYENLRITCIHEPVLLDTAGGIRNASHLLGDGPVLVHNGDVLCDLDFQRLLEFHNGEKAGVTALLRSFGGPLQVAWDADTNAVMDFRSAIGNRGGQSCLFTGVYVIEPEFISRIPADEIISVIPIFLDMIRAGIPIRGVCDDSGFWADLGTRDAYLDAHRMRMDSPMIHPSARIGKGVEISGASVIGPNVQIGDHAVVEDSILWESSEIASEAHLTRCIVRDHELATGRLTDKDI